MEGRLQLIFRGSVREFNLHCLEGEGEEGENLGRKALSIWIFGGTEGREREGVDAFRLNEVLGLFGKEERREH